MRIYTKQGDAGETKLMGSGRVPKDHMRCEACGCLEELNALLGLARAESGTMDSDAVLRRVQEELFVVGAELASAEPALLSMALIGPSHVAALEVDIDRFDARLEPLHNFILPGGTRSAAALHVARTVCLRAERRAVTLYGTQPGGAAGCVLTYLNRLGDLLFVLARAANAQAGAADVLWRRPS